MREIFDSPEAYIALSINFKSGLALLALCTLRLYALAIVFPPLSDQGVQGVVRNAVCLTLGSYVAWGQPLSMVAGLTTIQLVALLLKEAVFGLLLGFAASTVFWVAEGVGQLIDNQAGYNNVQQTNPSSGQQSTPVGNLLAQLSHSCFWMLGGITVLTELLFESFRWWPLDRLTPDWSGILQAFLQVQMRAMMTQLITLAAPMLIVLLLIDLGFGVIGKTADKLEPNSLAQPVKGAVTLLMLSLLVALYFEQARPMLALTHLREQLPAWMNEAQTQRAHAASNAEH